MTGEQFGEERLSELMRKHRHQTAEELKQILFNAAEEFCGHAFRDDAAVMVVTVD
jgi:serine phosphatase RsbU (regulator of sigma subunit)